MRDGAVIRRVTTPATTYDLATLATVKALIGVTATDKDAAFSLWISQASKQAQNFMNNPIVVETLEEKIWPRDDGFPHTVRDDINTLQLSRWPAVSITSVVETIAGAATTLSDGTDFISDLESSRLYRLDLQGRPKRWAGNPVVVNYVAGWATVPADVVSAVVSLVKILYFGQSRDPMVRQENIHGVGEMAFWFGAGPSSRDGFPSSIADQLDNYRVPVIA